MLVTVNAYKPGAVRCPKTSSGALASTPCSSPTQLLVFLRAPACLGVAEATEGRIPASAYSPGSTRLP